jgi:hypothetical protein
MPISYPTTASGFLRAIEDAKQLSDWHVATIKSERDDESPTRIIFRLASDDEQTAFIAYEFGKLMVNFDKGAYYFELDRLYEDFPNYSWKQHMSEKDWVRPVEMSFLAALCEVIQPPKKP